MKGRAKALMLAVPATFFGMLTVFEVAQPPTAGCARPQAEAVNDKARQREPAGLGTPDALIRNRTGSRELGAGMQAVPWPLLCGNGRSGSCTESIFGKGCSTVRTPERFEYRFLVCPGWPQ